MFPPFIAAMKARAWHGFFKSMFSAFTKSIIFWKVWNLEIWNQRRKFFWSFLKYFTLTRPSAAVSVKGVNPFESWTSIASGQVSSNCPTSAEKPFLAAIWSGVAPDEFLFTKSSSIFIFKTLLKSIKITIFYFWNVSDFRADAFEDFDRSRRGDEMKNVVFLVVDGGDCSFADPVENVFDKSFCHSVAN